MNTLYYGDNLDVLRRYGKDESIELIYLDPPFKSDQDFNVLFEEHDQTKSTAQFNAFEDTWEWNTSAASNFDEAMQSGHGRVPETMAAFRTMIGTCDMLAYLSMMATRLIELHRVLKPTGSIYLHCDPTASHYLKLLMDAIFGPERFRNEIIWERTTGRKSISQFGRVHDVILFYTKSASAIWHPPTTSQTEENARGHDMKEDDDGLYRLSDLSGAGAGPPRSFDGQEIVPPAGRHWQFDQDGIDRLMKEGRIEFSDRGNPRIKTYVRDLPGISVRDVWVDIEPINSAAAERLGYPTQKPEALLQRILLASSNEGDLILDPFCGCGTAIAVAQRLNRDWIGVDITHLATNLIKHRLLNGLGIVAGTEYLVVGEPTDLAGAEQLASENKFQFQAWALGLVGARVASSNRKGADKGIDGRLFFHDDAQGAVKNLVLSVKGGATGVSDVRDLSGVMTREQSPMGVLITLQQPTRAMSNESAAAGFYESPWGTRHPKLQIITVEALLAGHRIDMPPVGQTNVTFKRAPKAKSKQTHRQKELAENAD